MPFLAKPSTTQSRLISHLFSHCQKRHHSLLSTAAPKSRIFASSSSFLNNDQGAKFNSQYRCRCCYHGTAASIFTHHPSAPQLNRHMAQFMESMHGKWNEWSVANSGMTDLQRWNTVWRNLFSMGNIQSIPTLSVMQVSAPVETPSESSASGAQLAGTDASTNSQRTRRRLVPKRDILSFTPSALKRIKYLLSKKKGALGLSVGIRKRGCNGLSYTLDYVMQEPAPGSNEIVENDGIKVYVDQTALFYVIGTEMNYIENEVEAKFEWKNPKAKSLCGCGESFTV